MSKKVVFYLILDLIGVGITLFIRWVLCDAMTGVSDPFIKSVIMLTINGISIAVCLFILFFFLLYWWSDKKWANIKQKFKKKR